MNLARDTLRRRDVAARVREGAPVPLGEPELDETWAIVRSLPERYRTALAVRFHVDEQQIRADDTAMSPTVIGVSATRAPGDRTPVTTHAEPTQNLSGHEL